MWALVLGLYLILGPYIHIYIYTHTLAYEHARMRMLRGSSIFFWKKLIICIHYNLGLLHFPITKKLKGVMRNYFTCKSYYEEVDKSM